MAGVRISLIFLTGLCLVVLPACEAKGKLEIKFTSYWSNCTDSVFFWTSPCDASFEICVDKPGTVDFSDCFYDHKQSGVHEHGNYIVFDDTIGDIPNPRVIQTDHFQSKVAMLSVRVTDYGFFPFHRLATVSHNFSFSPAASESNATWTKTMMSTTRRRHTYRIKFEYRAYCEPYYYTSECDVYCRDRDDYQGHYSCNHTTGEKKCHPGWTGSNCNTDINECLQGPCFNNAQCTNLPGSYECRCPDGFIGQNCDLIGSQCYRSPCQNNGTCSGTKSTYSCLCPPQWTGTNCHIPVDMCQSNPCRNNGSCYGSFSRYTCVCAPGWTGENCVTAVNACDSLPCQHGGSCRSKPRGLFECSCTEEYEGQLCEFLKNPCSSSPCQNLGTCHKVTPNSYSCSCAHGWEGERCERRTNFCASGPCKNGATCTDTADGYLCHCPLHWKGNNCTTEVDPCHDLPCQNGGTCRKTSSETQPYGCVCPPQYEGAICEMPKDPCRSNPCYHGKCLKESHSLFKCVCNKGWSGVYCHKDLRRDAKAAEQKQLNDTETKPLPIVLACLGVLIVFIIIIVVLLIRRRRRRMNAKERSRVTGLDNLTTPVGSMGNASLNHLHSVPCVAYSTDIPSFQNLHNAAMARSLRTLPPPGGLPSDVGRGVGMGSGVVIYPLKSARGEGCGVVEEEERGAVGGRAEMDEKSWAKGEKSCFQPDRRAERAGNDYTDFAHLQKSFAARGNVANGLTDRKSALDEDEAVEENPYHYLNDLHLKWPDESHDVTGADVASAPREAAGESVVQAGHLDSTDEDEDEGIGQEDLNRLRKEVLQKPVH